MFLCFLLLLQNGTVQCEAISCPPPQCPVGTAPTYVRGACCKECQRKRSTLDLRTFLHLWNYGHTNTLTDITARNGPPADWEHTRRLHKGCLTIDQGSTVLLSYLLTCPLRWAHPFAYTWTNQLFTSWLQNTDGHQSHRHEPVNLGSLRVMLSSRYLWGDMVRLREKRIGKKC